MAVADTAIFDIKKIGRKNFKIDYNGSEALISLSAAILMFE